MQGEVDHPIPDRLVLAEWKRTLVYVRAAGDARVRRRTKDGGQVQGADGLIGRDAVDVVEGEGSADGREVGHDRSYERREQQLLRPKKRLWRRLGRTCLGLH